MVDPHAEVYIVSKVHGGHGKMVKLTSNDWGSSHTVSVSGGIHLNGIHSSRNDPVGGDISPTGYEVNILICWHAYKIVSFRVSGHL